MTRSIGDLVAASVGVSWEPEVTKYKISTNDRFMIIASDGVWEFLENVDVIEIIHPYYNINDIEGACDQLMKDSLLKWKIEEDENVDDITFILIFFYH